MLLEVIAYCIAVIISIPLLVLSLQCFLAVLPCRKFRKGERSSCAVLIPAHDEEVGLGQTLENVKGQLRATDRLIVVADNCSDQTAEIAKASGAETVVRNDPENRGKGFALQAGIDYLADGFANDLPVTDVVVVLDADCQLGSGTLDELVCAVQSEGRTVQAQYLMHAPPESGASTHVSAFAFLTKNLIRARGMASLGLSVPLTGSGMAFPWQVIQNVNLGSSEIVEDLDLGLKLVLRGEGPRFCESARVDSYFPTTVQAEKQQRKRWEHGFIGQMVSKTPALLLRGLRGDHDALASALDLMVPPLSLLVIISALTASLLLAYAIVFDSRMPLYVLLASCGAASVGLFLAWLRFGRKTLPFAEVLCIPRYAFSKLGMYLQFPKNTEREWKRTER